MTGIEFLNRSRGPLKAHGVLAVGRRVAYRDSHGLAFLPVALYAAPQSDQSRTMAPRCRLSQKERNLSSQPRWSRYNCRAESRRLFQGEGQAMLRQLLCAVACVSCARVAVSQVDERSSRPLGVETLAAYETQELELPLDRRWEAFETAVTLDGEIEILRLTPRALRAPDFRVLVQVEDGTLREVEAPVPTTYRGSVRGEPGSRVAAALVEGQLWANIEIARSRSMDRAAAG